ncbi:MAG: glycosyltransferase family 4 protein [Chloroflexi bacterium]|nr:glycosyltransferase family 4 protein [Chloroflexota bacterium]
MLVVHIIKATGLAGAEAHLIALLPALRPLGIETELLVLAEPERRPEAFLAAARTAGIMVTTLPIYVDADPALPFRLARHLRAALPTIVHTHLIHADLHAAAALSISNYRLPIALVISRHNDDRFRRLAMVKAINRAAAHRARKLIAISDALAEFAVRVEGVPRAKVTRIHYGLDPQAYLARAVPGAIRREMGWDENVPVAAFVGRLTAQKGVETLIAAWPIVAARLTAAHLIVAGDGELRSKLQPLSPNPSVHFLGWRSDVPNLLTDADVLVAPSLWEGFGMVTLEAMAARKPVVASRVSALPEIVADGETGLLVPPSDPERLAEALVAVLSDPARARRMGEQGRARLEAEFSVRKMAERHAEVYEALPLAERG